MARRSGGKSEEKAANAAAAGQTTTTAPVPTAVPAFIIDRTYRVVDGKPVVYLFGRQQDGKSFLATCTYLPFFYLRAADREKAEALVQFLAVEETALKSFLNEPVVKVTVAEPKLVPDVRKILESANIPCFEADIPFTQRFVMEHGILSTMTIRSGGDGPLPGREQAAVDRIATNASIAPADGDVPLKVLSLDLEASAPEDGDLYCVSLVGRWMGSGLAVDDPRRKEQFVASLFLSNKHTHEQAVREQLLDLTATVVADEKTLLERLRELVLVYDPDIITGWNVIDFDLEFLRAKYEKHGVPFQWGRIAWPNRMRIESSFRRDSKAEIPGRMVLDGIQLLRSSFIDLDDYKLETAAQVILGEGKLITSTHGDKIAEIVRQYRQEPQRLVDYNRKDAELVLDILAAKNLIELTVLRSKIVGLPLERVRASIASLDSLYLRELHVRGHVAPSGTFVKKEEGITGGYVKESVPGIYDYVIVLDFKSLYPSVMRTFNIDPLDHRPGCRKLRDDEVLVEAPNGTCFVSRDGILPQLLQRLWEQRDLAKKRKDGVGSQAFKILMNSFFGVMASPNCRFFSMELANAITHFAQHFIKLTIARLESQGYEVIYGDTDSVFVNLKVGSFEESERAGLAIQQDVNRYLTAHIEEKYQRHSYLEIEFEKVYRKFLLPRTRGSLEGSKKRYAGLLQVRRTGGASAGRIEEAMDFTGLEFVRRDWTGLAKEFQLTLLRKIFHEEDPTSYVRTFVQDLKAGKHDRLLVYRKAVRKDLEEYVKTTPPHVKAARILIERTGGLPSTLIEYVMTTNGPEPVGYETGSIDYEHYIEKQVKPIADSVLCFFGASFDDVVGGSRQKTLFGF